MRGLTPTQRRTQIKSFMRYWKNLRRLSNKATPTKPFIRRISVDKVRQQMKQLVFVDARSATAVARNPLQVPGAFHVPIKKLDERLKELPRDRVLVTYCT